MNLNKLAKTVTYPLFSLWIHSRTKLSILQSYDMLNAVGIRFYRNRLFRRVLFQGIDWKRFSLKEDSLRKLIGTPKKMAHYREPIGIWFTIDSEEDFQDAPRVKNSDFFTYYSSCRDALLAVANQIATANKVKIALVPSFTCGTVHLPFLENGWKLIYYKINKDLTFNTEDVELKCKKYKPSLALFMEYSGMALSDNELNVIGRLKAAGCVTMVDRTQNIYSQKHSKEVDFYCTSLRKWFPCPDGAYLERNGDIPLPPAPPENVYNDAFAFSRSAMMFLNGAARNTKIEQYLSLANLFDQLSVGCVSQPARERNMSEYSKAVYFKERLNDEFYMHRRRENFEYIFHRTETYRTIRPVCTDLSRLTSAPFYYFVYTDNRKRLARYLRSKGVCAWIHYTKPYFFDTLDGESEYIYSHILSLPCDQRYSLNDMAVLCDALEKYEQEYAT